MSNATPVRRPWPTDPRYLAGDAGTILGPSGRVVRGRSNGKGYLQLSIFADGRYRNVRVHRIVCEAWHGPAPSSEHEVAHDDCDKSNNRPDNVSWKTYAENRDDLRRHHREGLYADRGPRSLVPCKLTPDDVRAIRGRYAAGVSMADLAHAFGVSEWSVSNLLRGRSYIWVE